MGVLASVLSAGSRRNRKSHVFEELTAFSAKRNFSRQLRSVTLAGSMEGTTATSLAVEFDALGTHRALYRTLREASVTPLQIHAAVIVAYDRLSVLRESEKGVACTVGFV